MAGIVLLCYVVASAAFTGGWLLGIAWRRGL